MFVGTRARTAQPWASRLSKITTTIGSNLTLTKESKIQGINDGNHRTPHLPSTNHSAQLVEVGLTVGTSKLHHRSHATGEARIQRRITPSLSPDYKTN